MFWFNENWLINKRKPAVLAWMAGFCVWSMAFVLPLNADESIDASTPSPLAQQELQSVIERIANGLKESDAQPDSLGSVEQEIQRLRAWVEKRKRESDPRVQHYVENVKPVFTANCLPCHGPALTLAELNLSTRELLLKGGSRGAAIQPGDPEASLLMQLIRHEREPRMPQGMEPLSSVEIEAIKLWIEQGAVFDTEDIAISSSEESKSIETRLPERTISTGIKNPEWKEAQRAFWSFQPLQRHPVPQTVNGGWGRNEIDQFVLAEMEKRGLEPSTEADRRTLIRRVYFDLIGLPPSSDEVERFMQDESTDAYERLVDALLDNPHFGERWARHWLDVARYADSGGYEFDVERPNAYPYRDFVIHSFNQDLPFDTFLKWQLAGDEYAPEDPLALAATGFSTNGPTIGNQEAEINRFDELDDIVSTTSQAMLGLTVSCARCHDHKFDPISQYDYSRLVAFFSTSKREERYLAPTGAVENYERISSQHEEDLNEAKDRLDEFKKKYVEPLRLAKIDALDISDDEKTLLKLPVYRELKEQAALLRKYRKDISINDEEIVETLDPFERNTFDYLRKRVTFLEENLPQSPPKGLTLTDREPRPALSFFLERGDPNLKKALVTPGFLSVMTSPELESNPPWFVQKPVKAKTTYHRTALAEWITDEERGGGALAARVYVNRLWMHTMGAGIVRTPNDFGFQGERPTHPELLDWLATELLNNSGSTKHILRLIVTGSAYRQSAEASPKTLEADPDNRFLTRRSLKRIEAEIQRDAILAVSGSLNKQMYGPGVKPRMHPDAIATGSTDKWPKDVIDGPETWRRSVYMFIRRSVLHPMMSLFDAPDATASCPKRIDTIVPTQALTMLNDQFVRDQAGQFAQRILDECGGDLDRCIEKIFNIALARTPNPTETNSSAKFIAEQIQRYEAESIANDTAFEKALSDYCQAVFNLNEFVYVQ